MMMRRKLGLVVVGLLFIGCEKQESEVELPITRVETFVIPSSIYTQRVDKFLDKDSFIIPEPNHPTKLVDLLKLKEAFWRGIPFVSRTADVLDINPVGISASVYKRMRGNRLVLEWEYVFNTRTWQRIEITAIYSKEGLVDLKIVMLEDGKEPTDHNLNPDSVENLKKVLEWIATG